MLTKLTNRLIWNTASIKEKRLVFKEAVKENPDSTAGTNANDYYEKLKQLANAPSENKVAFSNDVNKIAKGFVKQIEKKENKKLPNRSKYIAQIQARLNKSFEEVFRPILGNNFNLQTLLNKMMTGDTMKDAQNKDIEIPKIQFIAVAKKTDTLELQFALYDSAKSLDPILIPLPETANVKIDQPPTPKRGDEEKQPPQDKKAPSATPPKRETKETKETKEKTPAELGIRQVDQEAEAAEKARQEVKEKGVTKRVQYIDGGLRSGTIKPDEKGGKTVSATINDLYPDAVEGDTVDIVRYGRRLSAEYKNGKWVNTEKPKEPVKIFKNDRISYAALGYRERGPKAPESPKGYEINGYMRMRSDMAWLEIARTIMYMGGNPPNGDDFVKLLKYNQKPEANSPAQALKDLGYDVYNKEDVEAYAKILKEVNKKSPLYVWIIIPTKNQRAVKEAQKREQQKAKEQSAERAKQVARGRTAEEYEIVNQYFTKLINNETLKVTPRIKEIVNDEKLWNLYWRKGFKGKELLVRGFDLWGIPQEQIRDKLLHALTGDTFLNVNDQFTFSDLLEEFGAYTNLDGELSHDIDEFNKEMIFQQVGRKIELNQKKGVRDDLDGINPRHWAIYQEYAKKYEGQPELLTGERYDYYVNIVKGASFIVEGLKKLDVKIPLEQAKQEVEEAEAKAEALEDIEEETGVKPREHTEIDANTPEEIFLQTLFNPRNAKSLEDMAEQGERSGEATIYRQIKLVAAPNGVLDRTAMINEINTYIRAGLQKYLSISNSEQTIERVQNEIDELKKQQKTDEISKRIETLEDQIDYVNKTRSDAENMRRRCGLYGSGLADTRDMKIMEPLVQIKDNLAIPSQNAREIQHTRNLITEGFEFKRYMDTSVEKAAELKPWKNFEQIRSELKEDPKWGGEVKRLERLHMINGVLKDAGNPQTAMTLREFYRRNPEENVTQEQLEKEMKEIDDVITTTNLIDIDLAVDTTDPEGNQWRLGIAKRSVNIGKGWKFIYGGGINLSNGQPFLGGGIVKEAKVSKEWTADIGATAGFEPFALRPFAGVDGGFTWIIPGEDGWDTKVVPLTRGGYGASASLNLSQLYLGPHWDASIGREANPQREYKQRREQAQERFGYHAVEAAKEDSEKAAAIRALPEVGPFLFEMQINNNWSDEELVKFYNEFLKKTLDVAIMRQNVEDTGLISAYGVGGMINPVQLAIVIAGFMAGGALLGAPLTVAFFGKLGIFVGNKLVFDQELMENQGETQRKADLELIRQYNEAFPEIKIEIGPQTLEGRERIGSNEFVGDTLQRIVKTEQTPTNVEYSSIEAEPSRTFEQLQAEFLKNNIKLTIEDVEKGVPMYRIELLNTESYSIFADSKMAAGHNIITRNGKIFIATTENLTQLHVKRFDAFFPGAVEKGGAVQHTIVTISDNPYHRMGDISKDSYYLVESIYDRDSNTNSVPDVVENESRIVMPGQATWPSRVFDYQKNRTQLEAAGGVKSLYNAKNSSPEKRERVARSTRKTTELALTNEAMAVAKDFDTAAIITSVEPQPEAFLKQNPALYRELTTNPTADTLKKLDDSVRTKCKDGGQELSEEQIILFKEALYNESMSEQRESTVEKTIERRLNWAEKAIFTPFFEKGIERLKTTGQEFPSNVTGASLAAAFMTTVRHSLKNEARQLKPGESIFTAVGTPDDKGHIWNGIRKIIAASGKTPDNSLREGYDFSKLISLPAGENMDTEFEIIARILFDEHNEIPSANNDFLRTRLAKKLMFMGGKNQPNPIINFLHENPETSAGHFKKLIEAYRELSEGKIVDLENPPYKDAIEAFKKLCNMVKQAQLGEGTPIVYQGNEYRALYINGYYMLIGTNMTSGIYEECKNPATVYNERILIFNPRPGQEFQRPLGSVTSTAQYTPVTYNARRALESVGINAIFNKEFDSEGGQVTAPAPDPDVTPGVGQIAGKLPRFQLRRPKIVGAVDAGGAGE